MGRVSESNLQRANAHNTNTHKVAIVTQQLFSITLTAATPYRLPAHASLPFDCAAHPTTGVNGILERRPRLIRTMIHKRYPITWRIVFLIGTVLKFEAVFASTETNATCEPDWATDAYCDPSKCPGDYASRVKKLCVETTEQGSNVANSS